MTKFVETTPEDLKKLAEQDVLLVREENLRDVPWDHADAVLFILTQGLDKEIHNRHLITLDEPESSKYFRLLTKEEIMVYVFSDRKVKGKSIIWNMMIVKEKVEGHPDPKRLFVGAECLRTFCDANNVFYKTTETSDGKIISGSNLMWQKKEGENCREISKVTAAEDGSDYA